MQHYTIFLYTTAISKHHYHPHWKHQHKQTTHTHTLISPIITVSKIDISSLLITPYLILSKIMFYLTIFLIPYIVVISKYLAIVTINEVIRNRRVIYASPPVQ